MTITWTSTTATIGQLKPWAQNPRYSTKVQAKRLLESWKALGQFQTIAVGPAWDVYDGHQRLSALLTVYGLDYCIDVRQSDRALTDDERRKLVITAHVGAVGGWDWDKLSAWDTSDLREWGMDADALKTWNADVGQLTAMLESEKPAPVEDAEPAIDRADELRVKWGIETGQLWQLGEHRLICGDCTDRAVVERVMGGELADYGMHDPPYGIDVVGCAADSGGTKGFGKIGFSGKVKVNHYAPIVGDDRPFDPSHLLTASKYSVLWGGNYFADKLPPMKGWLVWDKKGREEWRDNFSDCELAWSNIPSVTRIFRHTWLGMVQEGERELRMHPTQKPVALFEKIISELFVDGDVVIDFYSGSGPTILACERLGRKCRAIEISPAYVAVALERWSVATGKTPEIVNG